MKWFLLARTLGMSVSRAQREISALEFAEWDIINNIDPCGEVRADIRNALTRQTMIQCHSSDKNKVPHIKNLMIDYWKAVRFPGAEAVAKKMNQWLANRQAAQKARKERKKKRK